MPKRPKNAPEKDLWKDLSALQHNYEVDRRCLMMRAIARGVSAERCHELAHDVMMADIPEAERGHISAVIVAYDQMRRPSKGPLS
jgi:hypothetical protein